MGLILIIWCRLDPVFNFSFIFPRTTSSLTLARMKSSPPSKLSVLERTFHSSHYMPFSAMPRGGVLGSGLLILEGSKSVGIEAKWEG